MIGDTLSCNLCVHYLAKSHRELVNLHMDALYGNPGGMSDEGLNDVLALDNLKSLKLNNTSITGDRVDAGVGPSGLENFSLVNSHQLTDHGLSKILTVIGGNLKTLSLRSTGITGEFNFTTSLENLHDLKLYYCWNLTDKGLNSILKTCRGDKLSHLDIGCSSITGEGLSEVHTTFGNVKRLNGEYTSQLTDKGLCELLRVFGSSLKSLNLNNSAITGAGLSGFTSTLPCLEDLYCYDCSDLTDKGLVEIFRICGNSMVSFKAFLCPGISGEGLDAFAGVLSKLEKLDLSNTSLNDEGLIQVLRICGANLLALDIGETKITGDGLSRVENLDLIIEHLNLNSVQTLTESGLGEIFRVCGPNIKLLNLGQTTLTSCSFDGTLPNLRKLDLSGEEIQDPMLHDLLKLCGRSLTRLNLRNSQVTCEGLTEYSDALSDLEELDLARCLLVSEQGLMDTLRVSNASLKYIDLARNPSTFECFAQFSGKLESLVELSLSHCAQLTETGLEELLRIGGESLIKLDLERTKISDDFRTAMQDKFPKIEIID